MPLQPNSLTEKEILDLENWASKLLEFVPKGLNRKQLRENPAWILYMSIKGRLETDWMDKYFPPKYYDPEEMIRITLEARKNLPEDFYST